MKTFLVPVDFSPVTESVIDSAISFSRAFSGNLVLLHIVVPPVIVTGEYVLPVEVMQDAIETGENAAKVRLAEYQTRCAKEGVDCQTVIRHGPPVALIHKEAEDLIADYIVMGSHGHGKLYDFFVGSTASGVIKKSKCGVIIVPPEDKKSFRAGFSAEQHSHVTIRP